jgi:hypothetical protein
MILTLLQHQWKSFWRSRNAGKSLAMQIFIGFMTLYFMACSLALGFFVQEFIKQVFPGADVLKTFLGFILYYFAFDIMLRFMMQELPGLTIQPYLLQNIRRSQLIRFLNIRSLFNFINLIPLLLFTPYAFISISKQFGGLATIGFFISLLAFIIFNHFLILYLKRKSIINSWWLVMFFVAIAAFFVLDHFKVFSLSKISSSVFQQIIHQPLLCVVPVLLAVASFFNNYFFLFKNLYLEDIVGKGKKREGTEYAFLNRFGVVGELIGLDLKLIIRNKRPRYVSIIAVVFLLYGFIFYTPEAINQNHLGILLFCGVFLSGLFIANYGQFLFAWQSGHFDGLMSGNLHIKSYIKSKFLLFTAVSTISFLIVSLYGFFSWKILVVQLAGWLYNIGINAVIAAYFATYSYKGIDITQKASFNFQGLGPAQWIYSFIAFVIPMIVFWIFTLLANNWAGVAAIGILGLISFFVQDWWIEILTKEFLKRKYKILAGFREK